jgi:hypothetical protein
LSSPAVENVKIKYQIQFPDSVGSELIARRTPIRDLKRLPAVESLASDFNGDVEVSPAKSACTDTEINVQTNMLGLVARVKAELHAEFDQQMEMKVQPLAARTTELETWRNAGFGGTSFDKWEQSAARKLEFI